MSVLTRHRSKSEHASNRGREDTRGGGAASKGKEDGGSKSGSVNDSGSKYAKSSATSPSSHRSNDATTKP